MVTVSFSYLGVMALVRSLELLTGVDDQSFWTSQLELRPSFSSDGSDGDTMVFCAELVVGKGFSVGQLRSQQRGTSSSERWMRHSLSLWTVVGRFSCTTETLKRSHRSFPRSLPRRGSCASPAVFFVSTGFREDHDHVLLAVLVSLQFQIMGWRCCPNSWPKNLAYSATAGCHSTCSGP